MAEILLCNQPINSQFLSSQCGVDSSDLFGFNNSSGISTLSPYTPYLVGGSPNNLDMNLLSQLGTGTTGMNLTHSCLSYGEDTTLALAEITTKLKESGIEMMGASTSLYGNRIQGFGGAVKKYQDALLAYRDAIKTGPAARVVAKQKAFTAFNEMQSKFRYEVAAVTSSVKARKGTVISNPTRGTNIARSSRSIAKLNISSQVQASQLVRYGKHTKFLGNGLAVINFTSRVGNIHNSYKAGGNWEREMFIESSSFVASTITSAVIVKAGLGFLAIATPAGWIGLIIGGAIIAGTAGVAAVSMDDAIKNNSGSWYDSLMDTLGIK